MDFDTTMDRSSDEFVDHITDKLSNYFGKMAICMQLARKSTDQVTFSAFYNRAYERWKSPQNELSDYPPIDDQVKRRVCFNKIDTIVADISTPTVFNGSFDQILVLAVYNVTGSI